MTGRPRLLRRLVVVTATAVVASGVAVLPSAADESVTVRVAANSFDPFVAAVDPGGTVTWLVQEGGHTIVADDRRFVFRGEGGGAIAAGTPVSVVVDPVDEYIDYHCDIHGGPGLLGMSGRIRVGDPPPPPVVAAPVIHVPGDRPTIAAALAVAAPGHRIEVAPGDHGVTEPIEVAVDDVTIVGTGSGPADVRLLPAPGQRGFPGSAFRVTAARVRIENLSVGGFRTAGLHLDGSSATAVVDVSVDGSAFTLDGILAERVTGATLRRTATVGARRAGIHVRDCAACGVRVNDARTEDNLVGVLVDRAGGVLVDGSRIVGNAAGVVGRAGRQDEPLRWVTMDVRHNQIRDNQDAERRAAARTEDRFLGVGAGVWLAGPRDSVVLGNDISGSTYGIVVAGDAAAGTRIEENRLDANVLADLAWDGLGAGVCFAANQAVTGPPATDPPALDQLAPCDRTTVGVPFPVVTIRLLLQALT